MAHLLLIKVQGGWANGDPQTEEFHSKIKLGQPIHGDFKRMRNAGFHRKFFALLNLGFEYWEPPETDTKWGKPEKNFDTFRKNVCVLAGYGHPVFNIDGSFKMEADSISFGNMDQDTFERLYESVLTVLLKRIPMMARIGEDEIDRLTDQILEFA
jgi:hypothetical protein